VVSLECWEDLGGRDGGRERRWGRGLGEGVGGSGEVGHGCFRSKEEGLVMFGLFCEEESGRWGMVPTGKNGGEDLLGLLCALAFCFGDLFEDPDLD
jgi:hypothetical protein